MWGLRVKRGASRTVVLIGGLALKFPSFNSWKTFLWGLLGNMQEAAFSKIGDKKICPVLFSIPGGFMNIMPRCTPISDLEFNSLNVSEWRDCGEHIIPVEDKRSSFGSLKGNIVALDYGGGY